MFHFYLKVKGPESLDLEFVSCKTFFLLIVNRVQIPVVLRATFVKTVRYKSEDVSFVHCYGPLTRTPPSHHVCVSSVPCIVD
jgi:hypothetical protein